MLSHAIGKQLGWDARRAVQAAFSEIVSGVRYTEGGTYSSSLTSPSLAESAVSCAWGGRTFHERQTAGENICSSHAVPHILNVVGGIESRFLPWLPFCSQWVMGVRKCEVPMQPCAFSVFGQQ